MTASACALLGVLSLGLSGAQSTAPAPDAIPEQEFDGLLFRCLHPLKPVKEAPAGSSIWKAQVTDPGDSGVTQEIQVVVSRLEKELAGLTPEGVCLGHERSIRSAEGRAAQLMKAERTKIGGQPMVFVTGSQLMNDTKGKAVNAYQASAAFAMNGKAYDITWLTLKGGRPLVDAILAVRGVRVKTEAFIYGPETLFGTSGLYTVQGIPFGFRLPAAMAGTPNAEIPTGGTGRYRGTLTTPESYITGDIFLLKEENPTLAPEAIADLLGYKGWPSRPGGGKPRKVGDFHIWDDLEISSNRHARLEILHKGRTILALAVSSDKGRALPARETISIQPLPASQP
jgi:hypothetical protein